MIEWTGTEEDGYVAERLELILYCSPIDNRLWSWSVTSKSPLANVANHLERNDPKATSIEARAAAEEAALKYHDI